MNVTYKPLFLQVLDSLDFYETRDYENSITVSSGRSITLLDMSEQLCPLYNSTMKGMDIKYVDVYRSDEYLNVTVTLSDPGINDSSTPVTFDDRRVQVAVMMKEQKFWAGTGGSVSHGWMESGRQWSIVFNITELNGWSNVDQIEVMTETQFFPSIDGKVIDGGYSIWWCFDACSFPVSLEKV